MALYTDIENELKPYCSGVSLSIELKSIAASRDFIERNYIKKELGKEQYDALNAAYALSIADTPTAMSAELQALWEAVMPALAPLSVWHYAGANAAELGDAGARERVAEDGQAARMWVSNLQRDTLYEQGMQELDNLLAFLDENKADYADWVAGTGYAGLKENLIQTTEQFNTYVNINGSRKFFKAMKPSIKQVEFLTIRRYISNEFYARLIAGIKAGNLTTEEKAALVLLQAAVAHLAFGACKLPIEAGSDGIYMLSSSAADNGTKSKTTPPANDLFAAKREHTDTGMQYLNEATDYLNKTATVSLLTQYFGSTVYSDPTKSSYADLKHNNDSTETLFSL